MVALDIVRLFRTTAITTTDLLLIFNLMRVQNQEILTSTQA